MPPHRPGTWIYSRTQRAPGQIIDVDELWGQTRYRVWMPSLNAVLLHRPEEVSGLDEGAGDGASSHAVEKVKFAAVIGRIFPVYLSREGRSFAQTGRHVWDRLASVNLTPSGHLAGTQGLDAYDRTHEAARSEGQALWDEMERDHLRRWETERAKAQQHFVARRRLIERVGLGEVRSYRLRHLEAEESRRMRELDGQKSLLPEIEPLVILSLKPS